MAQNYSTYVSSNPAELSKTVTLLKRYTDIDESGAPCNAWYPWMDVKALIEPVSGREYWSASQSNRESTVRITIRYRDGIDDTMRIMYDARDRKKIYEMVSPPINVKEQYVFIQLMCNAIESENEDWGLR